MKIVVLCDAGEVARIVEHLRGLSFTVVPYKNGAAHPAAVQAPPPPPVEETPPREIGPIHTSPKSPKGTTPDKTGPGRVIMSVVDRLFIITQGDVVEPLNRAGYSGTACYNHLKALVDYGVLVHGDRRGTFRRPTTGERIAINRRIDGQPQ